MEKKAQELADSDHFAADSISQQQMTLQRQWRELKLLAGKRTQKLNDALEAQKVGCVCMMAAAKAQLGLGHS